MSGEKPKIKYHEFSSELQLPSIINLIENDLSEPYTVYTYRYFIHNWPNLCFLASDGDQHVGVIICKVDRHKDRIRGYIGMLAVAKTHRKMSIGTTLVKKAVQAMTELNADEIVLETEYTNQGALGLYQGLGFIKDKRLYRYYLNGIDAFRLKLFCKTMTENNSNTKDNFNRHININNNNINNNNNNNNSNNNIK